MAVKSSIMDAAGFAFTQSKSRSDVVYSNNSKNINDDQNTLVKPKVKAKSFLDFTSPPPLQQQYQQQPYQPSLPHQFQHQYMNNSESYNHYNNNNNNNNGQVNNTRFVATNNSSRAQSDVTYRPNDTRTELTNRSDPGPYAYNPHQYPYQKQQHQFNNNNFSHLQTSTAYGNENYFNSSHQQQLSPPPFLNGEAKQRKPKISASAVMDFDNHHNDVPQPRTISSTIVKPRKVTISAQLNKNNNFIDQNYSDSRDDDYDDDDNDDGGGGDGYGDGYDDYGEDHSEDVEEEKFDDENGDDQAELDELLSLSSDPRIQRKFLDLQISNKSLVTLNAKLESTVKEQSDRLATVPSFETFVETQKKQSEHLGKVEELINTLSTKVNEQDGEIKIIKTQITEKLDEKEKARVTLFYDPKSLPLKSLPRIIFDRAYDDVTILFSVVTSLLYTVYVFPVIVIAKTAAELADKSREKIQGTEKKSS